MTMTKSINAVLLGLFFLTIANATDANQRKQKVHFKTDDNQTIVAWLEQPESIGNSHPAIILIHQGGSSKDEWTGLPLWHLLIKKGYAVLAYDIRQHGESSTDKDDIVDLFNNPKRAPLDLKAAIKFLNSQAAIDPERIGIIGASVGANLAVMASAIDAYPIRSAIAISGKADAAQNLANTQIPLKGQHLFVIASEGEQSGLRKQWAESFYQFAQKPKKLKIAVGSAHGSSILKEQPTLNTEIIQWLQQTL